MAKFNLVEKTVQLSLDEIIKYQLVTHCHLKQLPVSDADIDCLTTLGVLGESGLNPFCELVAKRGIFKTTQTVRNCLVRMEKHGLIDKSGPSKNKSIRLHSDLAVQTKGNILLIHKIAYVSTTSS